MKRRISFKNVIRSNSGLEKQRKEKIWIDNRSAIFILKLDILRVAVRTVSLPLFLLIVSLAITYAYMTNLQIAIWLGFTLPFDGLDGYLARKRNEQTIMGADFDLEIDVLFVLIACCILIIRHLARYEILIIALFRYVYKMLITLFGLQNLKRIRIGPAIAVYVFISVTLSLLVHENFRIFLIYSSLLLLLISFTYSFMLLINQKDFKHKAPVIPMRMYIL